MLYSFNKNIGEEKFFFKARKINFKKLFCYARNAELKILTQVLDYMVTEVDNGALDFITGSTGSL